MFTFCRNITNMNSELFSVGKYFITRFTFVIFWSFLNTVDFVVLIISFHIDADMIFHFGFATSGALQTFCCWLIFFEAIISVKRYLHFAIFTFFRNSSGHYFYFLRKKDPCVWNFFHKTLRLFSCQNSDKLLTHFSILAFLCYL